jgi:GTPase SAR1 family protein
MEKLQKNVTTFTIVVYGGRASGKTSLINSFVYGNFNEHVQTTVGACFSFKIDNIEGRNVEYEIWVGKKLCLQ